MFGSEYSHKPQILLSSFGGMHATYKKKAKEVRLNPLLKILLTVYMQIFGIPEIGFQIRSMYFEKIINERLSNKKIDKILDAGSGIGTYAFWLAKKFPKAQVIGGEIDREKLGFSTAFAKELDLKNTSFEYLDVTKRQQKKNKYDLIVNIDVLEHIDNYKQVIGNFYFLLAPQGYLYIHTPQPDQKRIFKSLQKWEHEGHVHEGYFPQELKKTLERAGFNILVMNETFGFFGKLSWELNHLSFRKGFVLAGAVFPILYLIAKLDLLIKNKHGLGTAILARKKNV